MRIITRREVRDSGMDYEVPDKCACGKFIGRRPLPSLSFVAKVIYLAGYRETALGFCSKKCAKEYVRKSQAVGSTPQKT